MTRRAIILSMIGAVFIPTAGYYTNHVAHLNRFVSGQLPIMAFGPLVLVVLFLNPLLRKLRPNLCFRKQELAVVMIGLFVGASITSNGLLRFFTRCLIMPTVMERTEPGWQKRKVLEDVPPIMLANDAKHDDAVGFTYVRGIGDGKSMAPIKAVPWKAWRKTLVFWITLIILFGVAAVSLALVVHPQWSEHELLPYPTAQFTSELMGEGQDGLPIYMQKPFIVGACIFLAYHLLNGCASWWPEYVIGVPLRFDFTPFREIFPSIGRGWSRAMLRPAIWPIAVALAYFLAKDVSFSVGISQPLAATIFGFLVSTRLISSGGNYMTGKAFQWQRAGSSIALAFMLVYIGRFYYRQVLKSAITFKPPKDDIGPVPIRALRALIVSLFLLTIILMTFGKLQWPFALGFVLLTMVAFLTVARIIAEVGIFYIQIVWYPVALIFSLFGGFALGPTAFVVLGLLSTIFVANPEESLMPFVTQGIKMGEDAQGHSLGKYGLVAIAGFILAVVIGIPSALWVDYSYGGTTKMRFETYVQPKFPFSELAKIKVELSASDRVEESKALSTLQRFTAIRPNPEFLWTFFVGVALVVATYSLRLRWPKWPIHPVLFLIWNTWASAHFFFSFLVAWAIRAAIDRVGWRSLHTTVKQLMIGVVAGELLGGMLWLFVGWIYFYCTGNAPPHYNIFPF